jgi:hypothetical protein
MPDMEGLQIRHVSHIIGHMYRPPTSPMLAPARSTSIGDSH